MRLSSTEIAIVKAAVDNLQIQGKNAHEVSALLKKIDKEFKKVVEKENKDNAN